MERCLVVINNKVRRERLNGRDYLVAPMTMLVSGVLDGSAGPLYYPEDEVNKDAGIWNGMPILLGHPVDKDGNPVPGRNPQVWANSLLGHVFEAKAESGKLGAEGWFDIGLTRKADPKLLANLEAGQAVELSTGLFTDNDTAPENAEHDGKAYTAIARNYKPDHLAVLPDDKGACSIRDGCGVNNSQTGTRGVMKLKTRKDKVKYLVANCKAWKNKEALLSDNKQFSDEELDTLVSNTSRLVLILNALNKKAKPAANADEEGEAAGVDIAGLAEFLGVTADAAGDPVGFIAELKTKVATILEKLGGGEPAPAPAPEPPTNEEVTEEPPVEPEEEEMPANAEDDPFKEGEAAGKGSEGASSAGSGPSELVGDAKRNAQRKQPVRQQTEREWLASAPPRIREMVSNAMAKEKEERVALLKRIVANHTGETRTRMWKRYAAAPMPELRDLAAAISPIEAPAPPSFFGATGGPVDNVGHEVTEADMDDVEAMTPQVYDFKANAVRKAY